MAGNPLAQGLGKGLGDLFSAFIGEKSKQSTENDLQNLFSSTTKRLNELISPQPTMQDQQMGKFGEVTMPTQNQPDFQKGLQYLYEQLPQFSQYGDMGAPYAKSLQGLFEDTEKRSNISPDYEIREINGQLVRYDKKNPTKFEPVYGEKKEEKKKYTVGDYGKMTAQDVMQLGENDFWDAFKFVSEDVRNELLKNPFVQQEYDRTFKENDFAPKTPGLRKSRGPGYKSPIGFGKTDKSKFATLKDLNERKWAGETFTETEEENYKVLQKQLGGKYNLDFDGLAKVTEKLEGATTKKQQDEILQSLEKGTYHNANENTSQEQIDYDAERINQWVDYMDEIARTEGYGEQWNIQKENFKRELKEYFNRGSITLKEYNNYLQSYK